MRVIATIPGIATVEGADWARVVGVEVVGGVEVGDERRALAARRQLPRRAPGATRPELIGARRVVVGRG